jgi:hypothetical protein
MNFFELLLNWNMNITPTPTMYFQSLYQHQHYSIKALLCDEMKHELETNMEVEDQISLKLQASNKFHFTWTLFCNKQTCNQNIS